LNKDIYLAKSQVKEVFFLLNLGWKDRLPR
jgi:hypothetical protein